MLERLLQQYYHLQELFHFQAKLFFQLKWIPMKRKDLTVAKKGSVTQKFKRSPAVGGFHQENISRKLEFVTVTQN